MTDPEILAPDKYKGVKGWLLLFCVGLTVFMPAVTFFNLYSGYKDSTGVISAYPGLKTLVYADALLSVALAVLGFYAGLLLWKVKPKAVKTAKLYLIALLVYSGITLLLPYTVGLSEEMSGQLIKIISVSSARTVIYVIIWFLYLSKSKRVKATYGDM